MPDPMIETVRDRLRAQVRREQQFAARVLAAEARLAGEESKRNAVLAVHNCAVAERRHAVADALIDYMEQAGVSVDRAALIFGRTKQDIVRLVRERRANGHAAGVNGGQP